MAKQLSDLFTDFLSMTSEEQLEKIRTIRHTRTIERPKAAVKREKKRVKKVAKNRDTAKKLLAGLTDEQRAELLKKLGESTDAD